MTDYEGLRELAAEAHAAAEVEKATAAAEAAALLLSDVTAFAASVLGEAAASKLVWENGPVTRGMWSRLDSDRTIVVAWMNAFEAWSMIVRIECGVCHPRPEERVIHDLSDLWVAMEYRCPHGAYGDDPGEVMYRYTNGLDAND